MRRDRTAKRSTGSPAPFSNAKLKKKISTPDKISPFACQQYFTKPILPKVHGFISGSMPIHFFTG